MADAPTTTAAAPRLKRVLTLWDLIFYGIVLIQPIAAIPLFGVAQELSHGQMLTPLFAGMAAMTLTAVSYGRLAATYPAAGSAYTYIGRGIHPQLGFFAGWAMFLGYLANPIINVIYVALAVQREFPRIPYLAGAGGFALLITVLNVSGIRWTARANQALLIFMCAIIGIFIVLSAHSLVATGGVRGLVSIRPFYHPEDFHLGIMATATSFIALTYIGFDGVTTLAEDVENPRRNVLLAVVLVVLFTGLFSGFQVYLAQLVHPAFHFAYPETAFMDVCREVGGIMLYHGMWAVLMAASFGSALTGQVGAARILYGMGRDNVLPRRLFAYLDPRRNTPAFNIAIIGALAFASSKLLTYERTAEVLNFGAILTFMSVNLAAFWQFWLRGGGKRRAFADAVVPLLGFIFCAAIWGSLPRPALYIGAAWMAAGLFIVGIKTRGFRERPVMIDFGEA
jgi:putrescine importer